MLKRFPIFLISILCVSTMIAQDVPDARQKYRLKYPEGPALSRQDSILMARIPEKSLPPDFNRTTLPPVVDNSTLPYLRPVFGQDGPSCGQAAMVGYNFTYEINCIRDLPADEPQNQYPTHFTWNFQNGGQGWYGVSYFHSIEMLRQCGNMNVLEYGGLFDDGIRWIDGYGHYLSGMYNRVRDAYSIRTGTEEGILALKSWLYNHMGEQEYGGVASYYANVPWNAQILNDTTPEGGKHVMTAWWPEATHAMTIVGYNDSIRWDYNNDGQYTNHLDLNGDQVIDPRDWEIGAVKFVNSHGIDAQDSGFCHMMYKCLAETFENGGVWNQAVHILDVHPDFEPALSFKVTLKHDYREKIRVMAGISTDTTDQLPEHLMDFPIVSYQGGHQYLQGSDTSELMKYLEFGLDVTPLLSCAEPGQAVKFFLAVDEQDIYHEGQGEISFFSLIDHQNGNLETIAPGTPVILLNNNRSVASLVYTPQFSKVNITDTELPPFTPGEPYSHQLEATGGLQPYSWEFAPVYRLEESTEEFPQVTGQQLMPNAAQDTLVAVALGFGFPFYGKIYDTVYVHIDGHLQFDRQQLPWPYIWEYDIHLRNNRLIAPMTHERFTIRNADGDGAWFESDSASATFRWQLSWQPKVTITELNFAVRIGADGSIDFLYGPSTLQEVSWIGGISAGNGRDWVLSPVSGAPQIAPGLKAGFRPCSVPTEISISGEGLISGTMTGDEIIFDLPVRVTDDSGISGTRPLQFSSGPMVDFVIHAGDDGMISYGDTVYLDVIIKNKGSGLLEDVDLLLGINDPYITVSGDSVSAGSLAPGDEILLPAAFSFLVALETPDQHMMELDVRVAALSGEWQRKVYLTVNAPRLEIRDYLIDDGDDGILDPGETAQILITLQNSGHCPLEGVSGHLASFDPELSVLGNPLQPYGTIGKGASVTGTYTVYADETVSTGFPATLLFTMQSVPGLGATDTLSLRIGRMPALVIDMDPMYHSGPVIYEMMQEMEVISDYDIIIPGNIDQYHSLFICLGYQNFNHVLSWYEGEVLAGYLDNGGKIYMEGRKTWRDDPWTPVHDRFYLTHTGSATILDTLVGQEGTFTQGIRLLNGANPPFSFYYLQPLSTAFAILHDNDSEARVTAVANNTGTYKTIGSLFELGTMQDLPPSTRKQLLREFLEFFDIYVNTTGVEEQGSGEAGKQGGGEAGKHGSLDVWPNPAGDVVHCRLSVVDVRDEIWVSILDVFGREVHEFRHSCSPDGDFTIDVQALSPGMYLVIARNERDVVASGKLVIYR